MNQYGEMPRYITKLKKKKASGHSTLPFVLNRLEGTVCVRLLLYAQNVSGRMHREPVALIVSVRGTRQLSDRNGRASFYIMSQCTFFVIKPFNCITYFKNKFLARALQAFAFVMQYVHKMRNKGLDLSKFKSFIVFLFVCLVGFFL